MSTMTTTTHALSSLSLKVGNDEIQDLLEGIPKLSDEQAGHLRHFHNLASQLDGEWAHMGSQEPGQEFLDAYRYQLAVMAYAAGAAHFHRLPAMRTMFRNLFDRLISKMMRREVWAYWYLTSQSGKLVDPDIKELRKPWADPIRRENIMFSGHLLLMVSLYSMLFNDDKYDREDALTFNWNPIFWGMGPEKFVYSRSTLQQAIIEEMERNNWMGVCCEPNSVFVVCNQFPLIAIRYNDIRTNTNVIDGILDKYQAAWKAKGMIAQNGLLVDWYRPKQDDMVPPNDIGFSAWAGAFMNSWNSKQVRDTYDSQALGFLTQVSPGRVNLNQPVLAHTIRQLIASENLDPHSSETLEHAKEIVASLPPKRVSPYRAPAFGYVAQWLSEIGSQSTLAGFLQHADTFLNPTWEKGGLYYPRNDQREDRDGNWMHVDPFTGNAAIGYARLNIEDGQKIMWERPWTPQDAEKRPWVDGFDLGDGVDVLRGQWLEEKKAMVVTLRRWNDEEHRITIKVQNLPQGVYRISQNGDWYESTVTEAKPLVIEVKISSQEKDIIVIKT